MKCTKICIKPLFCLFNLLFVDVLVAAAVIAC